ncbi:hypothetical protein [Streptomyces sp. NBC_01314]|uniref:hypothetical protein n=1 Tax=Streptomyces sp. NBC_01314 TaxID=2903821 RepID=UPI0030910FDE|nr:hypothetical protein OG622_27120 [Streptomyces sp. NBC_01314]
MIFPKVAFCAAISLAAITLSGCSSKAASSDGRTERETAKAYVSALNEKNVDALAELAPSGHIGTEREARKIIAAHGGRGLHIKSMNVSHDVGPGEASTHVSATDSQGNEFSTDIQMSREEGTWVIVLGHAPGFDGSDKSPASTDPAQR